MVNINNTLYVAKLEDDFHILTFFFQTLRRKKQTMVTRRGQDFSAVRCNLCRRGLGRIQSALLR